MNDEGMRKSRTSWRRLNTLLSHTKRLDPEAEMKIRLTDCRNNRISESKNNHLTDCRNSRISESKNNHFRRENMAGHMQHH
jgi:hypothetical protein